MTHEYINKCTENSYLSHVMPVQTYDSMQKFRSKHSQSIRSHRINKKVNAGRSQFAFKRLK